MSRPGDELAAELLWDNNGPALRPPPPDYFPPTLFQPFTCSAARSSRAHELRKRQSADPVPAALVRGMDDDVVVGLGGAIHGDDDAVPWLHCPVIDDGDSDTAPRQPEYCAGLLSALHAVPDPTPTAPDVARPSSNGGVVAVPATRAVMAEPVAPQPRPSAAAAGEGVVNFTFFSRPLQRPQGSAAASPSISNPLESTTVVQTAASRLRSTPLFSEHRMAWLQPPPPPPKDPRATVVPAPPGPPQAPPPLKAPRATAVPVPPGPPQAATDHRHRHHHAVELEAAATTVTQQHRLQPQPHPRGTPPDATVAVTTSSVCSGNGDRSHHHQARRSGSHQQQPTTECSVSQDEYTADESAGAARPSAAARATKRSRTAEVHNLSERRRRDRINEKMRALQELIPHCNKIDKASMLEEAIEYLKTLQHQVQMMSMGGTTGLCPTMLMPMAHFPPLGMGLGFGMGASAFDMIPHFAAAQFPCHLMPGAPVPHGAMFGMPGQVVMPPPFPHMNGAAAPPPGEQREAAAAGPVPAPGGGAGAAGDHPPVPPVVESQDQGQGGDQKLQHPKQT